MGLTVQPPDVNASRYAFAVADERTIRYGLGAVKGVGQVRGGCDRRGARARAVLTRASNELCRRAGSGTGQSTRARGVDPLAAAWIRSAPNRATLHGGLAAAMQRRASRMRARRRPGRVDMFGVGCRAAAAAPGRRHPEPSLLAEWSDSQRLAGERETLGLYLTGHPIAPFEADLRHFASGRIAGIPGETPRCRCRWPHALMPACAPRDGRGPGRWRCAGAARA